MTPPPEVTRGFPEDRRAEVAALYWQAFGAKLGRVMGPAPRALRVFEAAMNPRFCLTVTGETGTILGLAGYKTTEGGLAKVEWPHLKAEYGTLGGAWRAGLLSLLDRPLAPDLLLMDGIVVTTAARGLGLGSRLLDAIFDEARARGLTAVRLDVIDTNPRARALYERKGFVAVGEEHLGPLHHIFGFRSATRMQRRV